MSWEQFEAWAKGNRLRVDRKLCQSYESHTTALAWQAWQAATAAEREACAKVCDRYDNGKHSNAADLCADHIRARSNAGGKRSDD